MVKGLARDAVQIKMKATEESPLISVYEFCYAAGLGLRVMGIPAAEAEKLRGEEDFLELKKKVQELVKDSAAFADYPNGGRLQSLLTGCRYKGEMTDEARELFDMGFEGR